MSTATLPSQQGPSRATSRMSPVVERARQLRLLFEIEREFVRTATTLIPRVGEPELKYRLCEHVWEAVQHARFLRERGKELSGFGSTESVRPEIRRIFEEALRTSDGASATLGFYRVLKPALRRAYEHYLDVTEPLGDWPTTQLLREFLRDEERHASEIEGFLQGANDAAWIAHLQAALDAQGGWLGETSKSELPQDFSWRADEVPYTHPRTCNRGRFPVCADNFGATMEEAGEKPIIGAVFSDPQTDARVIRLMIYVWLLNEMDAVDYLATVFYDTPDAPLDMHHDMARHLWDEARHSQFGYRQLPKFGIDLMTLEQQVNLYESLVQMQPHERYALMTMMFEAGSFDIKAEIMDRVRELNDFEADTLLAFDRSDEQNHVRYGHRWLPALMEMFGEKRAPEEFVEATRAKFAPIIRESNARIGHTLPPDRRLTANDIFEIVKREDEARAGATA